MQSLQPTQPCKRLTHSGEGSLSLFIVNLDPVILSRRAYYKDMSSNLVIEKALRAVSDFSCLDLTNAEGLKVTKEQAKGYNQYLAAFDSVRFDLE